MEDCIVCNIRFIPYRVSTYLYGMEIGHLGADDPNRDAYGNHICDDCILFYVGNHNTEREPVECKFCEKEFDNEEAFYKHIMVNRLVCDVCGEIYSDGSKCDTSGDYIDDKCHKTHERE